MTITEAPLETDATPLTPTAPGGLHSIVTTTDHKVVGCFYIAFALLAALSAVVVGSLAAFESIDPDSFDLFSDEAGLAQATSYFWVVGVLGGAIPLLIGLATMVIPLQVGSPSVAFPRAAATAMWTWLVGVVMLVLGFILDGGFGANAESSESQAIALTIASTILISFALVVAIISLATTVIALRPEGMSLRSVPIFSWSVLVAGAIWLASIPVLVADLLIAYVDLRGRPAVYSGVEELLYEQVSWFFSNPQILVLAVPVLGIAADVVAGSLRRRQRNTDIILGGLAVFGLLAFGADMQSYYDRTGLDVTNEFLYLVAGIAIVVPFLVVLGGLLDTVVSSREDLRAPSGALVATVLAVDLVGAAVIASLVRAIEPLDLIGTPADGGAAVLAYTAGLAGAWAGWVWWSPKFTGRRVPGGAGILGASLLLLGGVITGVAWMIAGFVDPGDSILDTLSLVGFIGLVLTALGLVGALVATLTQLFGKGTSALDDEPAGITLEWSGPTPPPLGNFTAPVGVVSSAQPMLDDEGEDA